MHRIPIVFLLAIASSCAAAAGKAHVPALEAQMAREQFDGLKALEGEWVDEGGDAGGQDPVEARYQVTGAGSAVVETLFPGTPREMVTMYHLDLGRLMMTHYCTARNQPRMVAMPCTSLDPDCPRIDFKYLDGTNISSPNDAHMHELRITLVEEDEFDVRWTYYKDGKPGEKARFRFHRKLVPMTRLGASPR